MEVPPQSCPEQFLNGAEWGHCGVLGDTGDTGRHYGVLGGTGGN